MTDERSARSRISPFVPKDLLTLLLRAWNDGRGASRRPNAVRSAEGEFANELDLAANRFAQTYAVEDEDLVEDLASDWSTVMVGTVRQALMNLAAASDKTDFLLKARDAHFNDVLPKRLNRARVDRAVLRLLEEIAQIMVPSKVDGLREPQSDGRTTVTASNDESRGAAYPHARIEHALKQLLSNLAGKAGLRDARILQARLLENIDKARRYGDRSDLRSDRYEIMSALDQVAVQHGHAFLESLNAEMLEEGAARRQVAHNLPQPWYGRFIGRRHELLEIWDILRPHPLSRYHVVTIDGVGGVGKTSIALEAAYRYVRDVEQITPAERFEAIVWASAKRDVLTTDGIVASELRLRNIDDIYNSLADVLGATELRAGSSDQAALCMRLLSTRRVLIVVDNLETVDDPKVLEFIRDLPEPTKAIITSRHRSVGGAIPIRVGGLGEDDGIALVGMEAGSTKTTISHEDAQEIAERTEGVPLAIVWCVGQIALGHSASQVARRLASASGDFAKFVFEDAVELLRREKKSPALRVLMSLALFPAGATRVAVGTVGGLDAAPDMRDEALADLVKLSLVNVDGGRFSMLSLTREYALAEIARHGDFRAEAIERWYGWHVKLAERAAGGRLDLDAGLLSQLSIEHENLLWAVKASFAEERFDVFVRLLRGLSFYWMGQGYWREYDETYEKGRLLAPQPSDRIHLATRLAWLNILRRDLGRAEKLLAFANELLSSHPDDYEAMRIADYSGELCMEQGRLEEAEVHLHRSLQIAQRIGDRRGQFAALKYIGELQCRRGVASRARELLVAAEPFAAGTGEDVWIRGLAHAAQLRGMIYLVESNWPEAETAFENCLDYLRMWPDKRLASRALHGKAFACFQAGDTERARRLLIDAEQTYASLAMPHLKYSEILHQWDKERLRGFWETM